MKYFWTLFWTFILVQMAVYVGGSMAGSAFDFGTASIIGVIATIIILILPAVLPKDSPTKEGLH